MSKDLGQCMVPMNIRLTMRGGYERDLVAAIFL